MTGSETIYFWSYSPESCNLLFAFDSNSKNILRIDGTIICFCRSYIMKRDCWCVSSLRISPVVIIFIMWMEPVVTNSRVPSIIVVPIVSSICFEIIRWMSLVVSIVSSVVFGMIRWMSLAVSMISSVITPWYIFTVTEMSFVGLTAYLIVWISFWSIFLFLRFDNINVITVD